MGFFHWLFGIETEEEKQKRTQRAPWYYTRQEYMKELQKSRERWAETQKELYRMGGTTALGLTESAFSFEEEMAMMQEEAEEQAQEAQQEIEDLSAELANDIGVYERDKANAIEKYSNPE